MNQRKTLGVLVASLALGIGVHAATAGPVTWEFAGELTNVVDVFDRFGGSVTVGAPFSGSF